MSDWKLDESVLKAVNGGFDPSRKGRLDRIDDVLKQMDKCVNEDFLNNLTEQQRECIKQNFQNNYGRLSDQEREQIDQYLLQHPESSWLLE